MRRRYSAFAVSLAMIIGGVTCAYAGDKHALDGFGNAPGLRIEDAATFSAEAQKAGLRWAHLGVFWDLIEPNPPTDTQQDPTQIQGPSGKWHSYDLTVVDQFVLELRRRNIHIALKIVHIPQWAGGSGLPNSCTLDTYVPGVICSDHKQLFITNLYDFAYAAAYRYPQVQYWSFSNEPNLGGEFSPQDPISPYGFPQEFIATVQTPGRNGVIDGIQKAISDGKVAPNTAPIFYGPELGVPHHLVSDNLRQCDYWNHCTSWVDWVNVLIPQSQFYSLFDKFTIHTYDGDGDHELARADQVSQVMRNYAFQKPIWITEFNFIDDPRWAINHAGTCFLVNGVPIGETGLFSKISDFYAKMQEWPHTANGENIERAFYFSMTDGSAPCNIDRFEWGLLHLDSTTGNYAEKSYLYPHFQSMVQGPPLHNLAVSFAGGASGTVTSNMPPGLNCPDYCSALVDDGLTVTLTTTQDSTSYFTGWSGACSGQGSCQLTMYDHQSVTANFIPLYQLSVNFAGGGSGVVTSTLPPGSSPAALNCSANCSALVPANATVSLSAQASTDNLFTGWSGACSGSDVCQVSMTQAQSVTANFVPLYQLSINFAGGGTGVVTSTLPPGSTPSALGCSMNCSALVPANATVSLSAQAATGSLFTGWSGACSGTGICQVSMTQAQTVTANFLPPYSLTVNLTGTGAGAVNASPAGIYGPMSCNTVLCTATYTPGTNVTLTAEPNSYSYLVQWGGVCASYSNNINCSVTMSQSQSASAQFDLKNITVTIPVTGALWPQGSSQTISWTYRGLADTGSVRLDLLRGGMLLPQTPAISTSATIGSNGAGSFTWNIPTNLPLSSDYTVVVTSNSDPVAGISGMFEIAGSSPGIALTSVNRGIVQRARGTALLIRWIYTGLIQNDQAKIELFDKNGQLVGTIASSTTIGNGPTGSGSYTWTLPSDLQIGSGYSIRITDLNNTAINDQSHGFLLVR